MIIKYYISAAPDIAEDLWVKVYETQNDGAGAEVYTQLLTAPHSAPRAITVAGMDTVAHTIRLYGATTNTLYHEYTLEPTSDSAEVFEPIRFKIGDGGPLTPAAGTKTYQNDLLKGLTENDYTVLRNNYGLLFPVTHYGVNSVAGSFSLLGDDQMNDGEEFTVEIAPKFAQTVTHDSVVGKGFGGFVDLSASRSYLASDLRKLLRFTAGCTYTFSGAIPIGYLHSFQNYGTGTGTIKFTNAPLKWGTSSKSEVNLPVECEACFSFDGTAWNVVYLSDGATAATNASAQPGDIMGAGEYVPLAGTASAGDVAPNDPTYQIVHGLNISGNYMVQFSLRTTNPSLYFRNTRTVGTWWHSATNKPNEFFIGLRELTSEVQVLAIDWVIIKM